MLPTFKYENPNIDYPSFVDDARSWFGDTYSEDKLLYMNRLMIQVGQACDIDAWVLGPMETGFPVSTEPEQVANFRAKSNRSVQVIYST